MHVDSVDTPTQFVSLIIQPASLFFLSPALTGILMYMMGPCGDYSAFILFRFLRLCMILCQVVLDNTVLFILFILLVLFYTVFPSDVDRSLLCGLSIFFLFSFAFNKYFHI